MKDSYRHKGLRKQLVAGLRKKGITNQQILDVIGMLPRHLFLDKAFEEWAYTDKAFPIRCDQTISQPYTVAFQTHLLDLKKRQTVLEIGTGSGYQAAVLRLLGGRVFTIERHKELYLHAAQMFEKLGLTGIKKYHRDGYKGLAEFAPFDRILVTCGATKIPTALKEQLKIGGKLVIPVGEKTQTMLRLTRTSSDHWETEDFGAFRFVPFVEGMEEK